MTLGEGPEAAAEDLLWLTSGEAEPWLAQWSRGDLSVALAARLRRELSPERARLVIELAELRQRAAAKFSDAGRLFFSRRLLEQATGEGIADYKARRFSGRVFDLCCGLGGDLLGLAPRCRVEGVDRDRRAVTLARANLLARGHLGVPVRVGDVLQEPLASCDAFHIDPDRRSSGRRRSGPCAGDPTWDQVQQLRSRCPHAAAKWAPAAELPGGAEPDCEREWISARGECRQQVAWWGDLARHPGRRTATVVVRSGEAHSFTAEAGLEPHCGPVSRFLYEPDPAVLAADLTDALAAHRGLHRLARRVGYLSGELPVGDPLLAAFEVLDVLPLDVKRIKALLRARRIGRLELKQRGVRRDLVQLRRQLRVPGDVAATLLLCGGSRPCAVLADRLEAPCGAGEG